MPLHRLIALAAFGILLAAPGVALADAPGAAEPITIRLAAAEASSADTADDSTGGSTGGGAVTTPDVEVVWTDPQPFTGGGGATLPMTGVDTWSLAAAGLVLINVGTALTFLPAVVRRR